MNWQDHIIFHFLAGSHLYGTVNENSDEDHRGIIIPPIEYFYGLEKFEQWEGGDLYEDACFYDIRKFVRLAMNGNPNIIEYFWADTNVIEVHPAWVELRSYKRQFLSKSLTKPHMGMAQAHIKKLEVPGRKCGIKGRELIAKHGYNTKDAACVLRILWQCCDLLLSHHLEFPSSSADTLKDVLTGKYSFEQCKNMIESAMCDLRWAENNCNLPATPNYNIINKILIETVTKYHTEYNHV